MAPQAFGDGGGELAGAFAVVDEAIHIIDPSVHFKTIELPLQEICPLIQGQGTIVEFLGQLLSGSARPAVEQEDAHGHGGGEEPQGEQDGEKKDHGWTAFLARENSKVEEECNTGRDRSFQD